MLKADLHIHTGEDPKDTGFDYDAKALIDRAAELKFDVLAITNHEAVSHTSELAAYAHSRGILLIPGCEAEIKNKHIILLNVTEAERAAVNSFDDLRALRAKRGKEMLVIAAHPCFPSRYALGKRNMDAYHDLIDVVELSQLGEGMLNMNKPARRLAQKYGKAMVTSSDAHSLNFFGKAYTLVDAPKTIRGVLEAIREKRVEMVLPKVKMGTFIYLLKHAVVMRVRWLLGFSHRHAF
jgi:predicted metal-dependent phosphoesterase TrpH